MPVAHDVEIVGTSAGGRITVKLTRPAGTGGAFWSTAHGPDHRLQLVPNRGTAALDLKSFQIVDNVLTLDLRTDGGARSFNFSLLLGMIEPDIPAPTAITTNGNGVVTTLKAPGTGTV